VNAKTWVNPAKTIAMLLLLAWVSMSQHTYGAEGSSGIVSHLQQTFGLSEGQVNGALGTLLVFAREKLPKPEFDELAARMPRADAAMQSVKSQGIVTRPLDTRSEYEDALANVGIPAALAPKFAPAVIAYLGTAGYARESSMLARVFD
jgi:hypothetical protein